MLLVKVLDKLVTFIVTLFFIIILAFSAYALYDVNMEMDDSKLSDDILKYKPVDYKEEVVEKFNLADLQNNINEDICGWIRINDTNIDYPVLAPHTSLEYLDKNYKKEYSSSGSIFIDSRNDRLFTDSYTIIYGHNMAGSLMFADINKFEEKNFFDNHKEGVLYVENIIYKFNVYAFKRINSNKSIAYMLERYKNGRNNEIINEFKNNAINISDFEIDPNDKLVMLSTCAGVGTTERAVLLCKLNIIDSAENINEYTNSNVEKDEKLKEKNEYDEQRKLEEQKIKKELSKNIISDFEKDYFDGINEFLNGLWHNTRKLILYILILFTIIIYIIIIVKKLKEIKKNGKIKRKENKTEKRNIARIEKIINSNCESENFNNKHIKDKKHRNKILGKKIGKHEK